MADLTAEARRTLFDARYRLLHTIGSGGSGVVWRAHDVDTDAPVALKRVFVYSTSHRARVRREVAALRMLQLPGVVRLFDVGEVDGEPYLAMELLTGAAFPGAMEQGDWPLVVRRTLALCETLDRVHTLGVVHRDLKPANVIVEPDGRVVLLDFGLARGEPLAEPVTEAGGIVGTVGYLAPEQLRGCLPDLRADLYSLGVMLYEALGGHWRRPSGEGLRALLRGEDVELPRAPIEGVPDELNQVVAALLERQPERRPVSARAVAERLAEVLGAPLAPPIPIPFIGREACVERAFNALVEGGSFAVTGGAGTGKTRLLAQLRARLEAAGHTVVALTPGDRPFSGLFPVIGALPEGMGGLAAAAERLDALLRGGLRVLVDDLDAHDSWTRRVVDRCFAAGGLAIVARRPGAEVLEPLSADALRVLFVGPDPFLHLAEDGARLLYLRTQGLPVRIERELRTWLAVGRAAWDTAGAPPRLTLSRTQLDELEAWPGIAIHGLGGAVPLKLEAPLLEVLAWMVLAGPVRMETLGAAMGIPVWELELELQELEALGHAHRRADGRVEASVIPAHLDDLPEERIAGMHRQLAAARADEPESRMRHWLACAEVEPAVAAALEAAESFADIARLGRAKGLYAAAIRAARGANREDLESQALVGHVGVALSDFSFAAAEDTARYAERRGDPLALSLARLARAVADATRGRWAEAAAAAEALGPFEHETLEGTRQAVLVRCANLGQTRPISALLDELDGGAAMSAAGRSRFASWRGLAAYAAGDFPAAAHWHAESLALAPTPLRRIVANTNLAVALLDSFRSAEAQEVAERLTLAARHLRLPMFERWGFVLQVCAEYRLGRLTQAIDDETVAASALVGEDLVHANLCLSAAAVAWRKGDAALCILRATESAAAARAVNRPGAALLAGALVVACGGPSVDPVELIREATTSHPRIHLQVLALVAITQPALVASVDRPSLEPVPGGVRLEVLDRGEILRYLAAAPSGDAAGGRTPPA